MGDVAVPELDFAPETEPSTSSFAQQLLNDTAKHTVLLVDADVKGRRIIEVSLRKAGYEVVAVEHCAKAIREAERIRPDLIISELTLPDTNGLTLCRAIRDNRYLQDTPFIILTHERSIDQKLKGLQLGVTDYLTKPIYIREVTTRIEILIERRDREAAERAEPRSKFVGNLFDMNVVDLIQTVDIGRKSGVLVLKHETYNDEGAIYFQNGQIIDAEAGALRGELAIYRLMRWKNGRFAIHFLDVFRDTTITRSSQGLLMEGMRRIDEFERLIENLELNQVYYADALLPPANEKEADIVRLADGKRTLARIIDIAPLGDLDALVLVHDLVARKLLIPNPPRSNATMHDLLQHDAHPPVEPVDSNASHGFRRASSEALHSNEAPRQHRYQRQQHRQQGPAFAQEALSQRQTPPALPTPKRAVPGDMQQQARLHSVSSSPPVATSCRQAFAPEQGSELPVPAPKLVARPHQKGPKPRAIHGNKPVLLVSRKHARQFPDSDTHRFPSVLVGIIVGWLLCLGTFFLIERSRAQRLADTTPTRQAPATPLALRPNQATPNLREFTEGHAITTHPKGIETTHTPLSLTRSSESTTASGENLRPKVHPPTIVHLIQRGQGLQHRGHNQQALKILKRALKRNPNHALANLIMAEALLDLDRTDEAIFHIQRSLQQKTNHAQGLLLLGQAYDRENRQEEAHDIYETFIEAHPNHESAEQIRKILSLEAGPRL